MRMREGGELGAGGQRLPELSPRGGCSARRGRALAGVLARAQILNQSPELWLLTGATGQPASQAAIWARG